MAFLAVLNECSAVSVEFLNFQCNFHCAVLGGLYLKIMKQIMTNLGVSIAELNEGQIRKIIQDSHLQMLHSVKNNWSQVLSPTFNNV